MTYFRPSSNLLFLSSQSSIGNSSLDEVPWQDDSLKASGREESKVFRLPNTRFDMDRKPIKVEMRTNGPRGQIQYRQDEQLNFRLKRRFEYCSV